MTKTLFDTLEQNKKKFSRLEKAFKMQKQQQLLIDKTKEEIMKEDAQQWEQGREKRV
jgi:hypothetical protein